MSLESQTTDITENILVVAKVDKGNTTILVSKTEYVNKLLHFINKENIRETKTDPTNKFQNHIKETTIFYYKNVAFCCKFMKCFDILTLNHQNLRSFQSVLLPSLNPHRSRESLLFCRPSISKFTSR